MTSATNRRTVISAVIPLCGMVHAIPALHSPCSGYQHTVLLALLNCHVLDFFARLKLGGTHLSHFLLKQLPIPSLETIQQQTLFQQGILDETALNVRVLELTYTAWDIEPFAKDCGYDGPPFIWNEERRFKIRAELDAAYFHLYLGTEQGWGEKGSKELLEYFPTPRDAVDYIMETFPIVKRKDEKKYGSYRTKELILEIYDKMAEAIQTGQPYKTILDPPPGPPCDAKGNFIPMSQWDTNNWPEHIHVPREVKENG